MLDQEVYGFGTSEYQFNRNQVLNSNTLYKKVSDFPVPSRDVTNQTIPGQE
jgi:hypothetical protein